LHSSIYLLTGFGCLLDLSAAIERCGDCTTGEECLAIEESSTIGEILAISAS
jgi:hypothetical protein